MWQIENNKLGKEFLFDDFNSAINFILKIATIANELNHHPEIYNCYNKVIINLQTHDAGNSITDLDRTFASKVDQL